MSNPRPSIDSTDVHPWTSSIEAMADMLDGRIPIIHRRLMLKGISRCETCIKALDLRAQYRQILLEEKKGDSK